MGPTALAGRQLAQETSKWFFAGKCPGTNSCSLLLFSVTIPLRCHWLECWRGICHELDPQLTIISTAYHRVTKDGVEATSWSIIDLERISLQILLKVAKSIFVYNNLGCTISDQRLLQFLNIPITCMQNKTGKHYYFKIIHHMLLHVYYKLKPRSNLTKKLLIKRNIIKS